MNEFIQPQNLSAQNFKQKLQKHFLPEDMQWYGIGTHDPIMMICYQNCLSATTEIY